MKKFIVRKEYFGGIISEIKKYKTRYINNVEFEIIRCMNERKKDNDIILIDNLKIIDEKLTSPLSITIYPSLKCNSNCSFCFVKPMKALYKNDMTYEKFCLVVNQAKQAWILDIEIMGGEPFLIPWIINAIKHVSDSNIHCSINTNATLLTEKIISQLSGIKNLSLRISIQDNFKKFDFHIENTLTWCEEYKIKVDILSVLQKENFSDLASLILNLPPSIIKNVILLYNNPWPGTKPAYSSSWFYTKTSEFIDWAKKNSPINIVAKCPFKYFDQSFESQKSDYFVGKCLACISRFEVMPTGDVVPCVKYYFDDRSVLGNVFEVDLLSIWNNKNADDFKNKIDLAVKNNMCKCSWKDNCSGCIGYAESINLLRDNRCPNFEGCKNE